ncbi:MAG: glycosyltransferase [Bacteroidota bacterium]
MIYVVAGNIRFPFSRLLLSMNKEKNAGNISGELYGQYGSFRPEFKLDAFSFKRPMFPYQEHLTWIKEAEIVVSEAGEDIILLCLMMGKIPIILPRQKSFGEHVDNHQVGFARKLEEWKKAIVVYNEDDLPSAIHTYSEQVKLCSAQLDPIAVNTANDFRVELKNILEGELYKELITMKIA